MLTLKELKRWRELIRKSEYNTESLERTELTELLQLNHEMMSEAHRVHNDNMLSGN